MIKQQFAIKLKSDLWHYQQEDCPNTMMCGLTVKDQQITDSVESIQAVTCKQCFQKIRRNMGIIITQYTKSQFVLEELVDGRPIPERITTCKSREDAEAWAMALIKKRIRNL